MLKAILLIFCIIILIPAVILCVFGSYNIIKYGIEDWKRDREMRKHWENPTKKREDNNEK